MKKISILILALLIICSVIFAQSITVTSPGSGDIWYKNNTYNISWTKTGSMDANVKLTLYDPSGTNLIHVMTMSTPNDGSYNWTIPASISVGNYIVRVKTTDNLYYDNTESFTISTQGSTASITVSSPNGGETWEKGSTYSITWSSSELTGNVRIDLFKNNTFLGNVSPYPGGVPIESGIFSWTIDRLLNNASIPPGSNYKIKLSSKESFEIKDLSNNVFSIVEPFPGTITITKPKGGDIITTGNSYIINWETKDLLNPDPKIEIYLFKDDMVTKISKIDNMPPGFGVKNTGTYFWNVSDSIEPGRYVIKMATSFDGKVSGYSGIFPIKKNTETVDLEILDFNFPKFINYDKITKVFIRVINKGINWMPRSNSEIKFRILGMDKFSGGKFTYDGIFRVRNEKMLKGEVKVFAVAINQINWPIDICKITFAVYLDPEKSVKEKNRKNNFKEITFYRSEIVSGNKCGITIFPDQIKIGKAGLRVVPDKGQVVLPSDKVNIFMTFRNCCSTKQTFDVNFIFDWTESRSAGENKNIWRSNITLEPGQQKPLLFSNIKIPRDSQFKTLAFFSNNYKNRYPHSLGVFYKFMVKVD